MDEKGHVTDHELAAAPEVAQGAAPAIGLADRPDRLSGVENGIALVPVTSFVAAAAEANVRAALARRGVCDASSIHVSGADTRLSLSGTVHTWSEFRTARDAAWSTPGVTDVDNQLEMRLCPCPSCAGSARPSTHS